MTIEERIKNSLTILGEKATLSLLQEYNDKYRAGSPEVDDKRYDAMLAIANELYPDNAWFSESEVEPELITGKTVKLPQKMLSTAKAYSLKDIEKWATDVETVGKELGLNSEDILFKITSKLDGYASYYDGEKLYTRGNGYSGTDITRALINGLQYNDKKIGAGEIVVESEYFKKYLSDKFENSRNIIAGVIKEGELDPDILVAMEAGAVSFQQFSDLGSNIKNKENLLESLANESLWINHCRDCIFDTDGLVIEAIAENIKSKMGATNHHHKWQIAFKKNTEYHNIKVLGIQPQTSKIGRITPVVLLEPTKVSGVTISRATGHHYGNIIEKGICAGAVVRVCRSGLVIPYIESVVKEAMGVHIPNRCPSCNSPTELDGDNLMCNNTVDCPAQVEGIIGSFFSCIGNVDGFGPKIIEQLCKSGITSVKEIFAMSQHDFSNVIGGKTGDNLYNELVTVKQRPIEDWRFLAAFHIENVGRGGCEKLLQKHSLDDIFTLSIGDIITIDGFADKTATNIVKALSRIKESFDILLPKFTLIVSTNNGDMVVIESPISGKVLVFTGKMNGSRTVMEEQAKGLGAVIGKGVNAKTEILITGANVGSVKIAAAEKNGTKVITEKEYLNMVK